MQNNRRKLLTTAVAAVAASGAAQAQTKPVKKVYSKGPKPAATPLYSPAVSYGNLLFLSGKGAREGADVKAQTKWVLDEIQKELENARSSMEKVLKANVYLSDIKDFAAMNEVYLGRFGDAPPARTTVAPAGGLPGGSLVEIDVVAFI
ncbi:MAG TPA: RidA family protein [Bryobacteraceae bacterium]|nr:RidA family protein [Bryobacteraceae bacterium]